MPLFFAIFRTMHDSPSFLPRPNEMIPPRPEIWTVGHSRRELGAFLDLLVGAGIEQVADIRRFPDSRRQPHFGGDALSASLAEREIAYAHLAALGGRRGTPAEDSPNNGWRIASFGAYADYMGTDEFREGLECLETLAVERRTTMMCAEAVPWRCHRRLVADALLVRGWGALDIIGPGRVQPHTLTDFARVHDGTLTYPAE